MADDSLTVEQLGMLVFKYGKDVRRNKLDGLRMWGDLKDQIIALFGKNKYAWATEMSVFNAEYDGLVAREEDGIIGHIEDVPDEEHNKWELQHFLLQHIRIPRNEPEPPIHKFMQVFYNSGQLVAEWLKPENVDIYKELFSALRAPKTVGTNQYPPVLTSRKGIIIASVNPGRYIPADMLVKPVSKYVVEGSEDKLADLVSTVEELTRQNAHAEEQIPIKEAELAELTRIVETLKTTQKNISVKLPIMTGLSQLTVSASAPVALDDTQIPDYYEDIIRRDPEMTGGAKEEVKINFNNTKYI
jgi:hypothetical protein